MRSPAQLSALLGQSSSRLKTRLRPWICPFDDLLELVPERATLFDLGCGGGAWLCLVDRLRSPASLGGAEINESLVAQARALVPRARIEIYDGARIPEAISSAHIVTLIDVLHHVPAENQRGFLRAVHDAMAPGARLLLKDMDAADRLSTLWNRFHDRVLSGAAGWELRAATAAEWLAEAGFRCEPPRKRRMMGVYSHYLIVAEKPA